MAGNEKEKCTAYLKELRMLDDSRAYCSVALTGKEQGESSCTVLLAGVLTSNPRRGQAQKA